MDLAGRCVVVTGAGRGIGAGITRLLAERGARVAAIDSDESAAAAVASSAGSTVMAAAVDVRSWASVRAVAALIEDRLGPVDGLVNNAGISRVAPARQFPAEWWDDVVDVNLSGTWRCCQVFGTGMVERGRGAIVNMGSAYSEVGSAGRVAYAATKTGVLGLTRVLGVEWAPRGVRVNAVEPGYIDTPMARVTLATGAGLEQLLARVPAGRLGGADEVARCVAFLLSDDASYVTGATLRIDGGHLAYGGIPPASAELPPLEEAGR